MEEKDIISQDGENEADPEPEIELNEDGVPRPAPDPKNKLYTVISLLIFAVCYFGRGFIKDSIALSYSRYLDRFDSRSASIIMGEAELDEPPSGMELKYARIHKGFDSDMFYAAFSLPRELAESDDFPSGIINFRYGDVLYDTRFTIYPEPDNVPDYVYGDLYVSIDNPETSFFIYENEDEYTAVFRTSDYDSRLSDIFDSAEKIPMK